MTRDPPSYLPALFCPRCGLLVTFHPWDPETHSLTYPHRDPQGFICGPKLSLLTYRLFPPAPPPALPGLKL